MLYDKFDYIRGGSPNIDAFEEAMAKIEHAKYGVAFSSGIAAITAIFMTMKSGDHIISVDDVYGGTNRLLRKVLHKFGIENSLIDLHDLEVLEKEIRPSTKMILIETPTNPTLKCVDIKSICDFAKKKGILTLIDNTFATPILQNPILLGADIVMHSGTKYIGGHSDVCGGIAVTNSKEIHD